MTTRTIPQTIRAGFTGIYPLELGGPIPSTIYVTAVDVLGMSGTMIPQYIIDNAGVDSSFPAPNYQNTAYFKLAPTTSYSAGTTITADGTYEIQSDAGYAVMNVTVAPATDVTLRVRILEGATAPSNSGGGPATVADGANVVEGTTTDAAVTGDNPGTMKAALRGITKILGSVVQTVKAASTAAVATDTALVVAVSPNNVVKVGGITRIIQPTVTVTAGAYAAGNCWGGKLTLTNGLGSATPSTGAWSLLTLTMHTSTPPVLDCLLFGANPAATFTDKSAFPTLSAADNLLVVARISIASTDWVTIGGSSFATIKIGGLPISATTAGTLYSAFNVTSGTPTPAATTDFSALYTFFTDQ